MSRASQHFVRSPRLGATGVPSAEIFGLGGDVEELELENQPIAHYSEACQQKADRRDIADGRDSRAFRKSQ